MAISIERAEEVIKAHQEAGRPIGNVEFISTMWSERKAEETLADIRRFRTKPERATQKATATATTEPKDETLLTAMEFRTFIEQFPRELLGTVPKYMLTAVGLVMSNHCDYNTGTKVQLTAKALSDMSGVGHRGVVRVLDLLEKVGAIQKVRGLSHLKGRPSTEYRFHRSPLVKRVLEEQSIVVHEQSIVVQEQSIVVQEQIIRP